MIFSYSRHSVRNVIALGILLGKRSWAHDHPATKVFYELTLLKLLFFKYTQIQNNSQVHYAIKKIKKLTIAEIEHTVIIVIFL
ncbi:MAG: hypothetical protein C0525_07565 [Flavobacterium sp.]|nr:hypothetical protein [Flavobacterium sp.]